MGPTDEQLCVIDAQSLEDEDVKELCSLVRASCVRIPDPMRVHLRA